MHRSTIVLGRDMDAFRTTNHDMMTRDYVPAPSTVHHAEPVQLAMTTPEQSAASVVSAKVCLARIAKRTLHRNLLAYSDASPVGPIQHLAHCAPRSVFACGENHVAVRFSRQFSSWFFCLLCRSLLQVDAWTSVPRAVGSAVDPRLSVTPREHFMQKREEARERDLKADRVAYTGAQRRKAPTAAVEDHIGGHEMLGESVPDPVGSNLFMPLEEASRVRPGQHHHASHPRSTQQDVDHIRDGEPMADKAALASRQYAPSPPSQPTHPT